MSECTRRKQICISAGPMSAACPLVRCRIVKPCATRLHPVVHVGPPGAVHRRARKSTGCKLSGDYARREQRILVFSPSTTECRETGARERTRAAQEPSLVYSTGTQKVRKFNGQHTSRARGTIKSHANFPATPKSNYNHRRGAPVRRSPHVYFTTTLQTAQYSVILYGHSTHHASTTY